MEQHDPCRRACLRPLQLDLFGREPLDPTPVWTEIPAETRQELTGLMTRMLLESVRPAKQGGRTDDA
jgi:hypothetical protein